MSASTPYRIRWVGVSAGALAAIALSIIFVDRPLAMAADDFAPTLRVIFERMTVLGDSVWYLAPSGVAAIALFALERRETDSSRKARLKRYFLAALFLFLSVAVSGLATDLLKIIFGRARPPLFLHDGDFGWHPFALKAKFHGFPSGHANTVMSLALAVGFLWPRARVPLLVLAVLVALTRIPVEAHYLSDIIGGMFLALVTTIWLRGAFARRGWLFERRERRA